MTKDAYGNDLAIGDAVTYYHNGNSHGLVSGVISNIKTKVYLDEVKYLNRPAGFDGGWVNPFNCVLTVDKRAVIQEGTP